MTGNHQKTGSTLQPTNTGRSRWQIILPALILITVTLGVFWPVLGHQFLAYDDSVDVYQNPYLQARSLENLLHFWRYPYEGLYSPLTYTAFAVAALSFSHAVSDLARALSYIWVQAGGHDRDSLIKESRLIRLARAAPSSGGASGGRSGVGAYR